MLTGAFVTPRANGRPPHNVDATASHLEDFERYLAAAVSRNERGHA
jgi:hypothetical protein